MKQVNIHQAKTHLSRLIEDVESGEEVVIARHNKPVAKLVSYVAEKKERKPGQLRGLMRIGEDFDAPLPDDLLRAFSGGKH